MDDALEKVLISKALGGDSSAAPFLVSCYGERLLGYARAVAPQLSDADRERIVELAIEAGVRAISRYDASRGSLLAWFRGQVRFKTLEWFRSVPPRASFPAEVLHPEQEPNADAGAGHTTAGEARRDALHRAISRLKRDDQIVLALRGAEGLDYCEIAQRLGIREDAIRQRYARAGARLRKEALMEDALRDLCEEDET